MTIRIQHLSIDHDFRAWAAESGTDVTTDPGMRADLLSVVRHIMRDRSDCDQIPVVRMATVFPTNEWGHNCEVEVTYSTRGYRAIYGVTLGASVTRVQCYMD